MSVHLHVCVCVWVSVSVNVCAWLLPPPTCQGAPLSFLLCALALEVTSFGVRQAGTQQEQLSLSELLNFSGGEKREGED